MNNKVRDSLAVVGVTSPAFVFVTIAPLYYSLNIWEELGCMAVIVIIVGGTAYNVCRVLGTSRDLVSLPGVHHRMKPVLLTTAITMYIAYAGSIAGDIIYALEPITPFPIRWIVVATCIGGMVYGLLFSEKFPELESWMGMLNIGSTIALLGVMLTSWNLPRIDDPIPTPSVANQFLSQLATFQIFGVGFERWLWERRAGRVSSTKIGTTITLICASLLVLVYEIVPPYLNLIISTYNVAIIVFLMMVILLFGTVSGIAKTLNSLYVNSDLSQDPTCVQSTILTNRSVAIGIGTFIILFGIRSEQASQLLTMLTSVTSLLFWSILALLKRSKKEDDSDSVMNFVLFLNCGLVVFEISGILANVGIIK